MELFIHVLKEYEVDIVIIDKKNTPVAKLEKMMLISHYMICNWYIFKNILGKTTKFFLTIELVKGWRHLKYKVCPA